MCTTRLLHGEAHTRQHASKPGVEPVVVNVVAAAAAATAAATATGSDDPLARLPLRHDELLEERGEDGPGDAHARGPRRVDDRGLERDPPLLVRRNLPLLVQGKVREQQVAAQIRGAHSHPLALGAERVVDPGLAQRQACR